MELSIISSDMLGRSGNEMQRLKPSINIMFVYCSSHSTSRAKASTIGHDTLTQETAALQSRLQL